MTPLKCVVSLHRRGRTPNATYMVLLPEPSGGKAYPACSACWMKLRRDAEKDHAHLTYWPIGRGLTKPPVTHE